MLHARSKLFFAFLVICLGIGSMALYKPVQYQLVAKIPMENGSFITDNLQNIYIYSGKLLKKYDAQGKFLCQHDDKSYGDISYIDVTDPMKVMVFYKDFPELVYLDNTLSVNGNPISPADLGFQLTALACTSHDNGAWLYETQGLQLVRIDMNSNITQKTGNLVQLLGIPLNPEYMLEYNSYIYLNDSAQGILVFDQFGTYFKTIPIKGLTSFEVRGEDLIYNRKNKIRAFHLKTLMEDATPAPDSAATQVRIEKNMLYEACRDTLRCYQMK